MELETENEDIRKIMEKVKKQKNEQEERSEGSKKQQYVNCPYLCWLLTLHDIYRRKSRSPSRSIHAQLGESQNNPQCPSKSGPVRSFIGDDRF